MDYTIKKAGFKDIESIHHLMQSIALEQGKADMFFADDLEYIKSHIEKDGCIYAAFFENTCVAFIMVDIPGKSPHNLGYDINIATEQLSGLAHMDSIAVLPEYRGRGLQKLLLRHSEKELYSSGFKDFFATVHPENKASLKSFFDLGYVIKATKPKYGGYLRHILHKRAGIS